MKFDKKDKKKFFICGITIIVFALYFSLHYAHHAYPVFEVAENKSGPLVSTGIYKDIQKPNIMEALVLTVESLTSRPFDIFPIQWKVIIPFFVIVGIAVITAMLLHYREYIYRTTLPLDEIQGSAKFFENIEKEYTPYFTEKYDDKNEDDYPFDPNMILAKDLKMSMDNKKVNLNKNVLVIGGPGTGKSYRVVKPNLMQYNCTTVATDPSGELMACCAKAQMEHGIKVKLFSTSDMKHSNCYNPFDYIYDEKGEPDETKVSTMIYLFLRNADGAKQKSGDPFWEKSAKALLTAIAYYLLEEMKNNREVINFTSVLKMVQQGKVSEDSYTSESDLDKMMKEAKKRAEEENRESKAWNNYATFKLATAKTANSILITCAVDLQLFDTEAVKNLTRTDTVNDDNNLHLERLGYEQTALYINIPQANGTYNFLVSMMYSQLYDTLYTHAEKICPKKYLLLDRHNMPLLTNLDSEAAALKAKEDLKKAEIFERKTKKGAIVYEVRYGKRVLIDKPSRYGAEQVLKLANDCTIKKGSEYGETRLPWHVRCLMDEFANIGEVPEFNEKLTTMRKYEISCTIIIQSIAQLKQRYKDSWESIIGGCDSVIFLGSTSNETCEYISKLLGDTTVRTKSLSLSSKGGSQNFSYQKRPLRTPAEVKILDNSKCYVIIRGLNPFYVEKYNFSEHKHFGSTGNANHENTMTHEMMDMYFDTTPNEKRNKLKNRQKAALIGVEHTRIIQPVNEKETLSVFGAKTVKEAQENTEIVIPNDVNIQNMNIKINKLYNENGKSADTDPKKDNPNITLCDDDGCFIFGR